MPLTAATLGGGCSRKSDPAASPSRPPSDPFDTTDDDALRPARRYLADYHPPRDRWPVGRRCVLRYDVVGWTRPAKEVGKDARIGSLRIERSRESAGGRMAIERDRSVTFGTSFLRADVTFDDPDCVTPRSWALQEHATRRDGAPCSPRFSESGRIQDSEVVWSAGGVDEQRQTFASPPVSIWSLLLRLAEGGIDAVPRRFSLLTDFFLLQPNGGVAPGSRFTATLGGEPVNLRSYLVLGSGVAPTHVLVDDDDRPLLLTAGLESLALVAIES